MRAAQALVTCLFLLPAGLAGAEPLAPAARDAEQQACLAKLQGRVADPAATCGCMVAGLAESLTEADYEALAALVHDGLQTPDGQAAQQTAQAIVADCVGS